MENPSGEFCKENLKNFKFQWECALKVSRQPRFQLSSMFWSKFKPVKSVYEPARADECWWPNDVTFCSTFLCFFCCYSCCFLTSQCFSDVNVYFFLFLSSNSQYQDPMNGPDSKTRFMKSKPTPRLTLAKLALQRCLLLSYLLVNLALRRAVFDSVESSSVTEMRKRSSQVGTQIVQLWLNEISFEKQIKASTGWILCLF